jgi:hypothetical protein
MKGVLLVSALAAAITNAPAPSDLAFKPTKDAQVRKTFEEETRWTLDSMDVTVDGRPAHTDVPDMEGTCERKLVVLDKYEAVEGAVTLRLSREFEELAGSSSIAMKMPDAQIDSKVEMASELSGAHVRFVRKDASSPAVAKWARDENSSSGVLAALREDLDLRAFMTESGLSEGDHWKVDAATLADVLAPGGELALDPRHVESSAALGATDRIGATFCSLADNTGELAGEVLCTWTDTKKSADGELATIELEWESTSNTDQDDLFARRCRAAGAKDGSGDESIGMSWTSSGKGRIEWDLKAGCARAFELALESQIDVRLEYTQGSQHMGYRFKLSGESKSSATFEAAK